jgi:hypothetical protein
MLVCKIYTLARVFAIAHRLAVSDLARCYMLGHITARLGSQALLITNYEAQKFPFIRLPNPENPAESNILTFDRVLCDVPCSGDGTIRKGPEIGKLWSPKNAEHLHPYVIPQTSILSSPRTRFNETAGSSLYGPLGFAPRKIPKLFRPPFFRQFPVLIIRFARSDCSCKSLGEALNCSKSAARWYTPHVL